jgi:hypothetical protein
MSTKDYSLDILYFVGSNLFLYFQSFLFVVLQMQTSFTNLLMINISIVTTSVFSFLLGAQVIVASIGFSAILPHWKGGILLTLKKNLTNANICGFLIGGSLIFRAIITIIDAIAYPYLQTGKILLKNVRTIANNLEHIFQIHLLDNPRSNNFNMYNIWTLLY